MTEQRLLSSAALIVWWLHDVIRGSVPAQSSENELPAQRTKIDGRFEADHEDIINVHRKRTKSSIFEIRIVVFRQF